LRPFYQKPTPHAPPTSTTRPKPATWLGLPPHRLPAHHRRRRRLQPPHPHQRRRRPSLGIVIILQGVSHIIFAIGNRHLPHWSWHLLIGFIDLLIGSLLLPYPDITLVVLPFLVGFWFLLRGISLILYAVTLRHFIVAGWGWFLAGGIFIAAFAAFIIKFPQLGYGTIVLWTAIALVATGISNILLAFRLKNRKDDTEQSIIV
jgi:uncharacterized membrane protein HdeD (DUF308 family)